MQNMGLIIQMQVHDLEGTTLILGESSACYLSNWVFPDKHFN